MYSFQTIAVFIIHSNIHDKSATESDLSGLVSENYTFLCLKSKALQQCQRSQVGDTCCPVSGYMYTIFYTTSLHQGVNLYTFDF